MVFNIHLRLPAAASSASNPAAPPLAFMDVTEAAGIDFVGTIDGGTLVRTRRSAISRSMIRACASGLVGRAVWRLEVVWPDGPRQILNDILADRQVAKRQR